MLCGRCGYTNLEDARYCVICGAKIEGEPVPPLDPPVGDVPCPHCGERNEAIAANCRFCGKKMKAAGKKNAPQPVEASPEHPPAEPAQGEAPAALATGGAVEADEMRVLFGESEEQPREDAPPPEAPPTVDDLEAELEKLDEEAEDEGAEKESEPDASRAITNPDEMAKLIAGIKASEPVSAEEPHAEPEAAPAPADSGGAITDPDEMAQLIASVRADEPAEEAQAESEATSAQTDEPAPAGESAAASDEPAASAPLPDDDEEPVVTPYESVAANPRNLAEEEAPPDPSELEGDVAAAKALSVSLDSMITDLLEVEIKEPSEQDYVPPDESGFPSRTRTAYRKKFRVNAASALFRLVVLTTCFVCGLSIGLWTSYFLM